MWWIKSLWQAVFVLYAYYATERDQMWVDESRYLINPSHHTIQWYLAESFCCITKHIHFIQGCPEWPGLNVFFPGSSETFLLTHAVTWERPLSKYKYCSLYCINLNYQPPSQRNLMRPLISVQRLFGKLHQRRFSSAGHWLGVKVDDWLWSLTTLPAVLVDIYFNELVI